MDRVDRLLVVIAASCVVGIAGVVLAVEQTEDTRPVVVTPADPVAGDHAKISRASR